MPSWLQTIIQEYGDNPFEAMWFVFGHGGALIFIPIMIQMAIKGWLFWIQEKFKHHTPHTLFRIEVPQNNEQSMKAVEQIFVQLYGIYNVPDYIEKWWDGFVQEEFSFELVSDGGYISYYVRTPSYYKDVTQAAFYAHYPDAILSEVDDYCKEITVDMINEEKVAVWGSEMALENDDVQPIKTYPMFEHQIAQKAVDPFANILELLSRMEPGEKLWYQIMAQPTDLTHFKERAHEAIAAIVEPTKVHHGPDWVDKLHAGVLKFLEGVQKALFGGEYAEAGHDEGGMTERQRLTTPEHEFVEEVDKKSSRWPFHTKVRFMYFSQPKQFNPKKARRGMLASLRQYRFINAFREGTLTRTDPGLLPWRYIRTKPRLIARARRMYWAYKSRDMERGEHEGFILSTEELASLFHFPQIEVRAPFVAKSQSRGVEPPTLLKFDDGSEEARSAVSLESGSVTNVVPTVNVVNELPSVMRAQVAVAEPPTDDQTTPSTTPSGTDPTDREAPSNLPFVE